MAVTGVCLINLYVTLFFTSFVVSTGQNQMTGENSCRTGPQHEDKQAQSAFPEQRVEAEEGTSAFLNCLVDNRPGVENLTVQWSKDGVLVHLYKHRKDQVNDQAEEFRGKTTLNHEGLKRGNVSLELQPVHLSNSGRYVCFIPKLNYRCSITLNISKVSNGQNNMTKGEKSSTTGPPEEDNQGCQNRDVARAIVLSIVFLIFGFVIVILIILARRHEATKSETKRTDEENQLMPLKTNHQGASLSPSTSTPELSMNQTSAPHLITHTDTHG